MSQDTKNCRHNAAVLLPIGMHMYRQTTAPLSSLSCGNSRVPMGVWWARKRDKTRQSLPLMIAMFRHCKVLFCWQDVQLRIHGSSMKSKPRRERKRKQQVRDTRRKKGGINESKQERAHTHTHFTGSTHALFLLHPSPSSLTRHGTTDRSVQGPLPAAGSTAAAAAVDTDQPGPPIGGNRGAGLPAMLCNGVEIRVG